MFLYESIYFLYYKVRYKHEDVVNLLYVEFRDTLKFKEQLKLIQLKLI